MTATDEELCCCNCFDDVFCQEFIKSEGQTGNCDFCGATGVPVAPPSRLHELFFRLLDYYEVVEYGKHYLSSDSDPTSHGDQLGFKLQEDWIIFSDDLGSSSRCNDLVEAVFDGEIDAHDLWTTIDDRWYVEPNEERTSWIRLAHHLKAERRFIPDLNAEGYRNPKEWLAPYIEETLVEIDRGTAVFRSRLSGRVNDDEILEPLPRKEMGAPPPNGYRSGRGNPPGISYLYLSSDRETAIAEKRPGRGSVLSVSRLRVRRDLRVARLTPPEDLTSPFELADVPYGLRAHRLLRTLGEEMSRPVNADDPPTEYLPSQFLCELILDLGFDGVLYQSAYGPGNNIMLFDSKAATPVCVELAEVTESQIDVSFGEKYDPRHGSLY